MGAALGRGPFSAPVQPGISERFGYAAQVLCPALSKFLFGGS